MREKYVYFQSASAASVDIGELTLVAVDKTSKGNLVSMTITESGSDEVVISVSGNDITATIGTVNNQHATSIKAAIDASAAASALVVATASGSTPITSSVTKTFLSGGERGASFPLSSFAGMHPVDNDSFRLYFKSMKNYDGKTSEADHVVVSDSVQINTIGSDTDGTVLRQTMNEICKAFISARTRPFDIVIGDDRGDAPQYIESVFINDVNNLAVDDAN